MLHEKSVSEMKGVFSAIFTPFDSSNEINFDALSSIAEYQLQHGLNGFYATGTTGEGLLLSSKERTSVIRHLVDCFGDRATVVAHVGHPSTDVAVSLARAAAEAGADWISSVAPIYYGTTYEGLVRHYSAISNATDLPFMAYSLGGVIDPVRDAALFELKNICGLKYTGANFFSVQQLRRRIERPVAMMSGFDEQFVAGQSFGFDGGIGSTYNFGPQFYSAIYENYQAGKIDKAAQLQSQINLVTDLMIQYENRSYWKSIMRYIGFDCGGFRLPYGPISDSEYESFAERLDTLGVLERNDGK